MNRAITTCRLSLNRSTRQMKVVFSLDTTSKLSITTLASIRVIHLYREPFTRVSITRTDD